MTVLEKLRRIDDNRLEVPKDYKLGMKTNGIIFVDKILEQELEPEAIGQVAPRIRDLVEILYNEIPAGVGSKGRIRLGLQDERRLLLKGARWAVDNGFGHDSDLEKIESGGCIDGADPDSISPKAYERGRAQQGTLGSGNHFLEVQYVDEIFDEKAAATLGFFKNQVTVMIHT